MRFEADSQAAIERIQAEFKQVFLDIKSDVKMPF
jgi:phosphomannomutase/phosphoglucomutase